MHSHSHNTRHRRKQRAPPEAKPVPATASSALLQSSSLSSTPPQLKAQHLPAAGSRLQPLPHAAPAPMHYQAIGRLAPIPAAHGAGNDNRGGTLAPPLLPPPPPSARYPHGLYPMLAAPPPPPPPGSSHRQPAMSGHPLSLDALIATAHGGGPNINYGLPFPHGMALPPPPAPPMEVGMGFQVSSAMNAGAPGPTGNVSLPPLNVPLPPPPPMVPPSATVPIAADNNTVTAETAAPTPSTHPAEASMLSVQPSAFRPMAALPPDFSQNTNTEATSGPASSTDDITSSAAAAAPAAKLPGASIATAATDEAVSSSESKENVPLPATSGSRQLRPARPLAAKTTEAVAEPVQKTAQSLDIALTPTDGNLLSDYNTLLCQHVELYQDNSGTKAKVGVRCKLCVGMDNNHGTAASYLASSISFISPNIGNIGTRHLLGGKCPAMPPGVTERLKAMRKTSMAQTKMPGRIGLDAYCRELAAKNGIVPYSSGEGIFYSEQAATATDHGASLPSEEPVGGSADGSSAPAAINAGGAAATMPTKPKRTKRKRSRDADALDNEADVDDEPSAMDIDPVVADGCVAQPTTAMEVDDCIASSTNGFGASESSMVSAECKENTSSSPSTNAEAVSDGDAATLLSRKAFTNKPEMPFDATSFVPGSVKLFWECSHCSSLPVPYRAAGSVVFSADPPTLDKVKGHLERCTGLDALPIPRDAKLTISGYSEKFPPIRISWDSSQLAKRSKTIEKQRAALAAGKPWPPLCQDVGSLLPSGEVNPNIETTSLIRKGDSGLVTQYAYTTATLVRKCYLTQTGGSRGGMSLGYPGLACKFCAGKPGQKRFFYTSADNFRNSFAHIPGHIISCPHAPLDVRRNLQALKAKRSEENKKLNRRDHKVFLERLWGRLHSKSKTVCEEDVDFDSDSDEGEYDDEGQEEAFNKYEGYVETKSSDEETDTKPKARGRPSRSRSRSSSSGSSASSGTTTSTRTATLEANDHDDAVTRLPTNATTVVLPEDKSIASDYCFYSLAQQMPCVLGSERQGSRGSAFPVGTPGLACRHCASSTNPREFYFRNADVMANNFSHVSSHILSCSHAPKAVKKALLQKKKANKSGSNRPILRVVWRRMQLWAEDQKEAGGEEVVVDEEENEENEDGDANTGRSTQGTAAAPAAVPADAATHGPSSGNEGEEE